MEARLDSVEESLDAVLHSQASLETKLDEALRLLRDTALHGGSGLFRAVNLNCDLHSIACMLAVHSDSNVHPHGTWGDFVRGHVTVDPHAAALFGAATELHLAVDQVRRGGGNLHDPNSVALFLRGKLAAMGLVQLTPAAERVCSLALVKCAAVIAVKRAKQAHFARQAARQAAAAARIAKCAEDICEQLEGPEDKQEDKQPGYVAGEQPSYVADYYPAV